MENKLKQLRPFLPKGCADEVQAYLLSKGTRVSKMSIYGPDTEWGHYRGTHCLRPGRKKAAVGIGSKAG